VHESGTDARIGQDDAPSRNRPDDLGQRPRRQRRDDDLGGAFQHADDDRRRDIERRRELAVCHEDQADRPERKDDPERQQRDQPSHEDPGGDASGRLPPRAGSRPRYVLVARDHPGTLALQRRGQPAAHDEPDQGTDPDRGGHHDDLDRDRTEGDRHERRADRVADPDRRRQDDDR
jgi:hypothetical protein